MTKIGYARVSSVGQSLKVQLDKLNKAKCTKVYKGSITKLGQTVAAVHVRVSNPVVGGLVGRWWVAGD